MARLTLQRTYTRSDPRGSFPHREGLPELRHNRLAMFWRPLIDLVDSDVAPLRLRMIAPVSRWLAGGAPEGWPWFSMIGVPELRRQVLRHAGLDGYDCRTPAGLPTELHSPEWDRLVRAIERFATLPDPVRALVIFQLAQLSLCSYAIDLAGAVRPNGDPAHDRYVYDVARVHARHPAHAGGALPLFEALAGTSQDPLLVLAACFQGIGHSVRRAGDMDLARRFETIGRSVGALPDSWHSLLTRSRFHRAAALLRLAEGRAADIPGELAAALELHERLSAVASDGAARMVADENARYLVELRLRIAGTADASKVRACCAELAAIDPYCVETRLTIGDAHVTIGDYAGATRWYHRAGELGTGSGAVAWFRAAQCFDAIGDRGGAVNAMARCLELDNTAAEPKAYLTVRG